MAVNENEGDRRPLSLANPGAFRDRARDVQDARGIDHGDAKGRHDEHGKEQTRIAHPVLEEATHDRPSIGTCWAGQARTPRVGIQSPSPGSGPPRIVMLSEGLDRVGGGHPILSPQIKVRRLRHERRRNTRPAFPELHERHHHDFRLAAPGSSQAGKPGMSTHRILGVLTGAGLSDDLPVFEGGPEDRRTARSRDPPQALPEHRDTLRRHVEAPTVCWLEILEQVWRGSRPIPGQCEIELCHLERSLGIRALPDREAQNLTFQRSVPERTLPKVPPLRKDTAAFLRQVNAALLGEADPGTRLEHWIQPDLDASW